MLSSPRPPHDSLHSPHQLATGVLVCFSFSLVAQLKGGWFHPGLSNKVHQISKQGASQTAIWSIFTLKVFVRYIIRLHLHHHGYQPFSSVPARAFQIKLLHSPGYDGWAAPQSSTSIDRSARGTVHPVWNIDFTSSKFSFGLPAGLQRRKLRPKRWKRAHVWAAPQQ